MHDPEQTGAYQPDGLPAPAADPAAGASTLGGAGTSATVTRPTSDSQPIKIVPKGLRSFDANDADFFLELLPGPRDRHGLPDSLRFWKTRIEEVDADKTFTVGLIYGPSGCGKSSLVKAGLLPCLSDAVIAVYVEATGEETETRLLNGLRKGCLALPDNLGLKESLAAVRSGQGIPVGKKVVIILDQFEQWLHAKTAEENTELVDALQQCDAGRVQCILMVRDNFWPVVSRFLRGLEVRLVEGENSALVDLFPLRHAEKVLAAFGRASGVLPDNPSETSEDQKQFLEKAVSGLAQEDKVICVRLALFAEMMKGKAWTPASLKAVGGTVGVGVTFLEETFSAETAPPEYRYHQKAARADLQALLPDAGSDIKGHMRSYAELLEASGYSNRPKDFADLIRILDSEIRFITPTNPDCKEEASPTSSKRTQKYYQLTHDYLVHSLREWLIRKQKETRQGRAELKRSKLRVKAKSLPLFRVWYGTNRKPKSLFGDKWGYTGERSDKMNESSYGCCDVIIPESHTFGSIGSSWYKRMIKWNDDRIKMLKIVPHWKSSFWSAIENTINIFESDERQALIYIHGYNVSFESAAIRAAQIGFDLKVSGIMAFYSWCSKGETASYTVDEASIDVSESAITDFLCSFAEKVGPGKVHIIAHSMGNRGLLRSLQKILAESTHRSGIKFGQIFLAAPDMDAELFRQAAQAYQLLSTRSTLYASPKDKAVGLSQWLHGAPRAGFTPPVTVANGIDTIIIPGFNLDMLGHGYYAEAEGVLHDIFDTLRTNMPPEKRIRLRGIETAQDGKHWIMK